MIKEKKSDLDNKFVKGQIKMVYLPSYVDVDVNRNFPTNFKSNSQK